MKAILFCLNGYKRSNLHRTLLAAAFLFLAGCSADNRTKSNAPIGATNFKDVGNGWRTFECEIEGKNRKFLCHSLGTTSGTIVELKD